MKHPLSLDSLYAFLADCGIKVRDGQKQQFSIYHRLITHWSQRQNLISRQDIDHIVERHFLPSLYLSSQLSDDSTASVIDVGSGAGFPGVVVKIVKPGLNITLLDSARKKVIFLKEVREQLKIGVTIVCERSERYQHIACGQYDLIVSRAVTGLLDLWQKTHKFLAKQGKIYVLKGGDLRNEIREVEKTGIKVNMFLPSSAWVNYSRFLEDKCIVMMES